MDRSDMMHRMYDIKGPLVAKKFAARGFEAVYCPTKEEALKQAISYIPETDVVSRKRMSYPGAARYPSMKSACGLMYWNTIRSSTAIRPRRRKNGSN